MALVCKRMTRKATRRDLSFHLGREISLSPQTSTSTLGVKTRFPILRRKSAKNTRNKKCKCQFFSPVRKQGEPRSRRSSGPKRNKRTNERKKNFFRSFRFSFLWFRPLSSLSSLPLSYYLFRLRRAVSEKKEN